MRAWPFKRAAPDTTGLEESRQLLAKARADEIPVSRLVEAHRRQQRENHFGPRIAKALGAPHR